MKELNVAIVIWINKEGHAYFQMREEDGPLNGYLEFPGGKIEPNETPLSAAKREFLEETPYKLSSSAELHLFKIYNFTYPDRKVRLHVFTLKDREAEAQCHNWYPLEFTDKVLAANKEIIQDLVLSRRD